MDALLGRWLRWVTAGELAGFTVPVLVEAVAVDAPVGVVLPASVLAGAVEGAVLGWSQAVVLRDVLPGFSTRRWVVATSVAAAIAWAIGMTAPSTSGTWSGWPAWAVVAAAVPLGSALLVSIGVGQWFELRRHVPRAGWWVAANALAWGVGLLAFTAVATPLWQAGQPTWLVVLIGVLGGLVMASSMALTTGLALRSLLARRSPTSRAQTAPVNPSWRHAS